MHYNGPSVCKINAVLLRRYNDTSYSHCKHASFINGITVILMHCYN
ncbi:hypothetical protein DDB_G0267312 [Dictyostelium discoideum AX4]|nr:hypothetical protein DDB_G0294148 [Dictyostelium discoideum AX4]XP_647693.1 hypothetical protein DDB_G0267360 [Dictyostelium discoideum AX4]XP_647717.1 hypothetical protein DDB_G0267312 [Dictyostelium discoideum AX4]EAL60402.1 hypothetical protein DDB_G0294148 [Dictyostelium discoideum AX4]EAL73769.1 hypothetical protein DDB_G0267360 [Dictyostelium discoideum AX4]EAL73793.1 hypothetical protein DDB_G0267312 [Dictyostelium discoideum AX4]|eukprot:XP_628815.1 hypothetical protein DDB_G0294148 [Dictyostelium discoideum AX4]